jgi:hypothetical protein
VQPGRLITFRRDILPPSLGSKGKTNKKQASDMETMAEVRNLELEKSNRCNIPKTIKCEHAKYNLERKNLINQFPKIQP